MKIFITLLQNLHLMSSSREKYQEAITESVPRYFFDRFINEFYTFLCMFSKVNVYHTSDNVSEFPNTYLLATSRPIVKF